MQTIREKDRVQVSYEDKSAGQPFVATVCRLLTDQQEGLSGDVEFYAAGWMEISTTTCDSQRLTIMLGTDGKHYLDGRIVSVQIATN